MTSAMLVVATHERRHLQRQVRRERVERRSGGNSRASPACSDLEDPLRLARGRAGDARRDPRARSPAVRGRAPSSPATPRSGRRAPPTSTAPPGSPRSVVVAVAHLRRARVHAHPHPQRARLRPRSAANASCASTAASTASTQSRTRHGTRRPSSSPRARRAPRPRRAGSRRDAPTPPCIASGCSSHRRVEPSRSVNRNVTVPDGNSATRTPSRRHPASSKPGNPDHRHLLMRRPPWTRASKPTAAASSRRKKRARDVPFSLPVSAGSVERSACRYVRVPGAPIGRSGAVAPGDGFCEV